MKAFLPIFRALTQNKIRYVAVGGIATILHGYVRVTGDIDLIVDFESQNCRAALETLRLAGFKPRVPVDIMDFADENKRNSWINDKGMVVFSLGASGGYPIEVDLFVKEPLPFAELYGRSKVIKIEDIEIRIASIDDIILLKRQSARPNDLEDIRALELIKSNVKDQ